jgi:long-chain acyl-CoA synthetase
VQLLDEAFKKYSAQPAYTFMGKDLTYRQLDETSAAVGAWLQSKGLGKGTRVAIMMPNVLQYPIVLIGGGSARSAFALPEPR